MAEAFLTFGLGLKWAGFLLAPLLLLPFLVLAMPAALAKPARKIAAAIDKLSSAALSAAMVLAMLMVVTQLLVIIGRYIFAWSASWANEIIIYSFAGLFLLSAASALKSDAHVRVDILREKMDPKQRAGVDLAGLYIFLFPICVLILWASISPSFVRSWAQFEGSRETDGLPIYFLFRTLVPLFSVLLMGQGLSQALKAALTLRGQNAQTDTEIDTGNTLQAPSPPPSGGI